jgi:mono/diheme cytochrome c family protein
LIRIKDASPFELQGCGNGKIAMTISIHRRAGVRLLAVIAVSGLAAACSTLGEPGTPSAADPSVERGLRVASLQCSQCHQIASSGESPRPAAPPFATLRLRYNPLTLPRRIAAVSTDGHTEMPSFSMDPADVDHIAAYIDSLR